MVATETAAAFTNLINSNIITKIFFIRIEVRISKLLHGPTAFVMFSDAYASVVLFKLTVIGNAC